MREIAPETGWLSGTQLGPPGRETVCSCQSPPLHHLVDSPTRPSVSTVIYHTPLMMSHSREETVLLLVNVKDAIVNALFPYCILLTCNSYV